MKRLICVVLAIMFVISSFPVTVFAASNEKYIEITKENAPLRIKADGDARIVMRCDVGTIVETAGSCYNWKLSKWYKVKLPGNEEMLYIYSGNVKKHEHKTTRQLSLNDTTYKICDCGHIDADASTRKQKEEASSILKSTSLALPLIALDGPLPLGDFAAAAILVLGVCVAHDYAMPAAQELADIISEADFDEYLADRNKNACSMYSFRRVVRYPGGLKYVDQYCMDAMEAYVYISLLHGDVYTVSEDSALTLAAMFGSAIMERDNARPGKDVTSFFYHYHAGTDRQNKAHIFFGLNDLGMGPV